MKFYQLPIGQRFELEGKRYVKTTPLVACLESDGSQKFIKRAVQVRLLGDKAEIPGGDDSGGESAGMLKLINQYHEAALAILRAQAIGLDQETFLQLEKALSGLKDELIREHVQ